MRSSLLCAYPTKLRWPRIEIRGISQQLIRHHQLHNTHHSMSTEQPIEEVSGQESNQTMDTTTQAPRQPLNSKNGKDRTHPSTIVQTSKQTKGSGINGGSKTRPTTAQATHQPNQPRNSSPHTTQPFRKAIAGHNSIHSTATSIRPSFLDNQWRKPSIQQQTPQTADTEGLTQALGQLTTEDNDQATVPATKATKSRWRTARPHQQQQATQQTTMPKNRSSKPKPNSQISQPGTTPPISLRTRSQQTPQTSQKQRGMATAFLLSLSA